MIVKESVRLDGHDFLFLISHQCFKLLDVFIVQFLQLVLSVLLQILRKTVLDSLLQFVLDFATHIAHLHLSLLSNLATLLHKFLTALIGTQSQLKNALEAGAKDFIQKPLDKEQVLAVVKRFLEGR